MGTRANHSRAFSRAWMRGLSEAAGAAPVLHWLDVADEECLARLRRRNATGEHAYQVTDADFALFTSHFVAPTEAEGFVVSRQVAPLKPAL